MTLKDHLCYQVTLKDRIQEIESVQAHVGNTVIFFFSILLLGSLLGQATFR